VSGAAIADISGYRVFHGTSATRLNNESFVAGASNTTHTVTNLSPGVYYFAVSAVNRDGIASGMSSVVSKTIP
jgi:hypothetical protein